MRRIFKILGWLAVGLLLALLALPWWLGGGLSWASRPLGFSFDRYERLGYTRFAVAGVRYQIGAVEITAARVEADTPLVWAWRHLRGTVTPLLVKDWRVEVGSPGLRPKGKPKAGWLGLRRQLFLVADILRRWVPLARVEAGEVKFPGGPLTLKAATWNGEGLAFEALAWHGRFINGSVGFLPREDLLRVRLATPDNGTRLELESRGAHATSTARWQEQPLTVEALFGEGAWLPEEAQIEAQNWVLNPELFRLSLDYAFIRGNGRLDWRGGNFVLDLAVKGEPGETERLPPLDVSVHGRGDLDTFTIETLRAAMPGLVAQLSEPVRLSRNGQLLSGPSRLALEADLARQHWVPGEGRVTGEARIEAGEDFQPHVAFQVGGRGIKVGRWGLPSFEVSGTLDWPAVQITGASVRFGDGESVQVSGGTNFRSREAYAAVVRAELKGSTVKAWLPETPEFSRVVMTAKFEGPWAELRHRGEAQVSEIVLAPLQPLAVRLDWEGKALQVDRIGIEASSGDARFSLAGAGDRFGAKIDALRFYKAEATWLALEKPARVEWQPLSSADPLVLAGKAGRVDFDGNFGRQGRLRVQVKDFSSHWLRDWLVWRGPDWRVNALDFLGQWDNGPISFSLGGVIGTELSHQRPVELQVKATGDGKGLKIETLQVREGAQEAVVASGALPLTLWPLRRPFWQLNREGSLEFVASTRPAATFWSYLEEAGLRVEQPQVNLALEGSWQTPRGIINLRVPRLAASAAVFKMKLPQGEALDVALELDREQIVLRRMSALLDGQQILVEGRMTMPEGGLLELKTLSLPALVGSLTGRLQIPQGDMTALAAYAPTLIAPKGELAVDLNLDRGEASGFLRIVHAGTRPLGPLGVLQDLTVDLALVGRGIEIRTLEARMGGQKVKLNGSAKLTAGGDPWFDLSLQGTNLPFVRQVGLLLRGDLDLKLVSLDQGGGKISGNIKLRDSLFFTDVGDLVPKGGGGNSVAARPPYFSVEQSPFNRWQLEVNLSGERFLRLRTPVFNGLVSMQFHLSNTLGEPRAVGQAQINEGLVLLPFATFTTQQGAVQLTQANPYEPMLFVTGTSRRYGYDLRMELSGSASNPVMLFSSSPPLESEQILLLVMAGETPNNEVSYSGTQRAARFGAFIGKSLFSSISGESSAADRLELNIGERVSRQGRETYNIEYRLGRRWSVVGEYDEFDDYNVGMKLRLLPGQAKEEKADAK